MSKYLNALVSNTSSEVLPDDFWANLFFSSFSKLNSSTTLGKQSENHEGYLQKPDILR